MGKKFDAEMFREQAQRVLCCVQLQTATGWHLGATALRIESTGSSIRLIAIGGSRSREFGLLPVSMAVSSWDAVSAPFTYHIPKASLDELFEQSAEISLSKLKEASEDGRYPPYQEVLQAAEYRPTKITVDAKEMLNAVELVGLLANETMYHGKMGWGIDTKEKPIDFIVHDGGLFIEAANYQAEYRSIDAVVRGERTDTFRLNATRLVPFLETVKGCVTLYPHPKLVEFTDRQFRFLIMQMRRQTAVSEAFSNDEPLFAGGSDNDGDWRGTEARKEARLLAEDRASWLALITEKARARANRR